MRDPPQTPAVPCSSYTNVEYTHWPRNLTLRLIDEYGKNYKEVGSKFRSFKVLYEMIANILNTEFGLKLTGSQVNNKFQTLVRSYKAVVDNSKKTGRGRKYFEFEEQMELIFQTSKRINPEILLTENEVIKSTTTTFMERPASQNSPLSTLMQSIQEDELVNNTSEPLEYQKIKPLKKSTINYKRKGTRTDTLEMIRDDKKKFYENYINIQNEKLIESKRKNDLREEKNKLLKEYLNNMSKK